MKRMTEHLGRYKEKSCLSGNNGGEVVVVATNTATGVKTPYSSQNKSIQVDLKLTYLQISTFLKYSFS